MKASPATIGLGVTMTIGYGTLYYSFSVLAPEIAREFGWGQAYVFGVFSFGLLAGAVAAPVLGRLVDRFGARLILCLGSIAATISLALFAVMQNAWQFAAITLVAEFVVMAIVLVVRPWGLMGKQQAASRAMGEAEMPIRPADKLFLTGVAVLALALLVLPPASSGSPYVVVLVIDLLIAALFAASLHFIMGPAGMHSFGHAAYFGLGAYAAALVVRKLGLSMEMAMVMAPLVAAIGALIVGWFSVRLSGVYLAMLTLAFAQIVWAGVYQWDDFTGGSNGMTGVWPSEWLSDKTAYYYLTLVLVVASLWALRRMLFSPFGYALRAGRDSFLRADAIGLDVKAMQWAAFVIAGAFAGIAGALFAFSKGSISPEALNVSRSVDGLVMVLLGGIQTLAGPVVGAVSYTWLHDVMARSTEYWRALLGAVILILVLLFPQGIAGFFRQLLDLRRAQTEVAR